MTRLVELEVSAVVDAWRTAGLDVSDDGVASVGGVRLRFVEPAPHALGLRGWVLDGDPPGENTSIDGIPTVVTAESAGGGDGAPCGRLRALGIDHVVVTTPSLDRTCAAIEAATGEPLKRVREAGGGMRQGFHRFGPVVIEVLERPDIEPAAAAELWGFVLNVEDLYDAASWLGPDVLSPPKAAVQPGRYISSFRPAAALGLPVALMTPDPRHNRGA